MWSCLSPPIHEVIGNFESGEELVESVTSKFLSESHQQHFKKRGLQHDCNITLSVDRRKTQFQKVVLLFRQLLSFSINVITRSVQVLVKGFRCTEEPKLRSQL